MATGGEVPGHKPSSGWGEDLDNIKCQPCLEDGQLQEAVGICVDCDDYLCSKCFEHHTLPRPCRNHKLLDKDQMKSKKIRASRKDTCTEKCSVHEDEITKYYCTKHRLLGCTVCITLGGHSTCENVRFIPHVAKELTNNAEYITAEAQLKLALEEFNKVCANVDKSSEELVASCTEAIKNIREYRRSADEVLNKVETELIETIQKLKNVEMKKLEEIRDKYKAEQEELKPRITKINALQSANQNCSLYTEMMRTSEVLSNVQSRIKEVTPDTPFRKCQIKFCPNKDTLNTLTLTESFGIIKAPGQVSGKISRARHSQDLEMNTDRGTTTCAITGLAFLSDSTLVATLFEENCIHAFDTQKCKIISELKLSTYPWDVTTISSMDVAVTVTEERKLFIVSVRDKTMSIKSIIDAGGKCRGVDYRNGNLAVSFINPDKVKILSLQGSILHEIVTDTLGNPLFKGPWYITFGHDEDTLYVSNYDGNNIVVVKLDGTVNATYTDRELKGPLKPLIDCSGDVLVCSRNSHTIQQISRDCKKIRVLLSTTDGVTNPYSICHNGIEDNIVVGMDHSSIVKLYKLERDTK